MANRQLPLADAVAVILAGGRGERLYPLTRDRSKGAVPFAGVYRLIDFTLTNCLHSGVRRICVLPQYRYASLERHLRLGWDLFPAERGESLALLPPQQRLKEAWYCGTADAVYQNLYTLRNEPASLVLVLSSDQIYRMDYRHLVAAHLDSRAAVTIASLPVPIAEAPRYGILEVDARGRVRAFAEKPVNPRALPGDPGRALASAGIYAFGADVLRAVLEEDATRAGSAHDFGRDILPTMVAEGYAVYAFDARRADPTASADYYWRDIGYVDAYWEASMEVLASPSPFELCDDRWPIHTHQPVLPPARVLAEVHDLFASGLRPVGVSDSLLCGGVVVADALVRHSILSPRVTVDHQAEVVESVLLEGVQVGPGARLRRAIVDKHVVIPAGCTIGCHPELDRERFHVTAGGITVVPRGARIEPSGADADDHLAWSFHGVGDPASLTTAS